jgi:fumarate reductase flavoprotein subunit
MAMEVGGKLVGTGMMVAPLFKDEFVPLVNQTWALQWENNLWVNKYGDRFIDETMVYNFVFGGNVIEAQPGSFAWSVFDEQTLELLETKGSRTGAGGFIAPLTKLTKARKEMEQAVQKGSKRVAIADSIDELANRIGIDPVKLKNTVKQYNKIAETGRDEVFARDSRTVIPITKPKYYAIMVRTFFLTSIGGIAVTTEFEATNSKDEVIKGLYVVGTDAGGKYGGSYPAELAGSEYSFASTSGRLAGANAAKYVKGL